jgi:hypothetical protein
MKRKEYRKAWVKVRVRRGAKNKKHRGRGKGLG